MILNKSKLIAIWKVRKQIFSDEKNKRIIDRFSKIKKLFEDLKSVKVEVGDGVTILGKPLLSRHGKTPSLEYFGNSHDEMSAAGAFNGVENMANFFPDEYRCLI